MPGNFEPEHAFDILSALHRKTPIRLAGQQTEYGTAADLHTRLLRGWIRLPSKFRSSRHPRCNQNRSAVPLGIETHQLHLGLCQPVALSYSVEGCKSVTSEHTIQFDSVILDLQLTSLSVFVRAKGYISVLSVS